jgi:Tol biopolymer transport system component
MAIPNRETMCENLFNADNIHSVANVSIAKKINKIAYVDKSYRWNNGSDCCMSVAIVISNIDGSEPELLGKDCYEPYWSPNDDQIVFRSENGEINRKNGMPSQIAIYDYGTKTITKLTNDTIVNYSPVFSPNGEYILFQSDKNGTNIWMIDIKSLEAIQITDVAAYHLNGAERPNWIDNERFVFQGTSNENKTQIYESSVITKQIKQLISSGWNDNIPAASPDNSKIAFISDRSGQNQVWLYNLENKTFRQLTGFTDDQYVDVPWNRIEWLDNSTICYTLGDARLVRQQIE